MKQNASPRPSWLKLSPKNVNIVFFDLETTGGNPHNSSIIEIGAIKYCDGVEVGRIETLIKPKHPISSIVQKITGIKKHMVNDAPKIEDIFEDFMKFIDDAILVSHGASADFAFLNYYSEKLLKKPLHNFFLCTHLLVTQFLPKLPSKKLSSVAEHFNYDVKYAHTALDDAIITDFIFWKLYEIAASQEFKSCEDLLKLQGDQESLKKLGVGFDSNLLNAAPSMSGVLYILGSQQEITYLSASPNLKKSLSQIIEMSQENKDFQKILVDASGFKVERTANFLDALIREKNELKKLALPLDPRLVQKRSDKFLQIFIPEDLLKYAKKHSKTIPFHTIEAHSYYLNDKIDGVYAEDHLDVYHYPHKTAIQHTKQTFNFISSLKYKLNRKLRFHKKFKDVSITSHDSNVYFGYLKEGIGYTFGPFDTVEHVLPFINQLLQKYPFDQKMLPLPTRFHNLMTIIKQLNDYQNQSFKLQSGLVVISNNAFKEFEIFVIVKNRVVKKVRLKFEEGDRLKSSRYFTRLFTPYYSEIQNPLQPIVFSNDACDEIELFSYWHANRQGEGEWIEFNSLEPLFDESLL